MLINALKHLIILLVSMGSGAIVKNAVKATTPDNLKTFGKVTVALGSVAVGGFVADATSDHYEASLNRLTEKIESRKSKKSTD